MAVSTSSLTELHSNKMGTVYQDSTRHAIILELNGQQTSFNVHCFLALKRKVDKINLADVISSSDPSSDYQIINPCGCERCFVLNIMELIHLKDLLAGAKVMMELNSIVYQRLYNNLV